MRTVFFKGSVCHTRGNLPSIGTKAPSFNLVGKDLKDVNSADFKGKRVVLNIFPSLDTDVCAMSIRRFNSDVAKSTNTAVICISMDLPFAAKRFCVAEGIQNVITASAFRSQSFAEKYGVQLIDGPLAGLFARAVIIINEDGYVSYTDLIEEITNEPDYATVIKHLKTSPFQDNLNGIMV